MCARHDWYRDPTSENSSETPQVASSLIRSCLGLYVGACDQLRVKYDPLAMAWYVKDLVQTQASSAPENWVELEMAPTPTQIWGWMYWGPRISLKIYVSISISISISVSMYIYLHTYQHIYIYVYVYVYLCICIYMHTYIYIYICMYISIYMYTLLSHGSSVSQAK